MADDTDYVLRNDYGGFNPRFIGLTFLFDSPDDYNFVASSLTEVPESEVDRRAAMSDLHRIALMSVGDHQNRHYVDFLLSPYSMAIFRMRIQALINGLQAIDTFRESIRRRCARPSRSLGSAWTRRSGISAGRVVGSLRPDSAADRNSALVVGRSLHKRAPGDQTS